MRTLKISLFVSLLLCTACASKFDYVPLSEFRIDQNALKNHDTVEVIFASGGPDYNKERKYYYMYIAVSGSTGDTVRVLSLFRYDFGDVGTPTKVFISSNSQDPTDKAIFKNLAGGSPQQVVRNKAMPPLPYNMYPTVIGLLAESTSPDPQ